MNIKAMKQLLAVFWFEMFLIFITVIKQATASHYNRDLDIVERAPAWDWNTFLVVHLIAFGALLLLGAALSTIKFVHEAEQKEMTRKRNEHIRNKSKL